MPVSEARLNANRLNARKSTGPRTEEGKARSRANSYKHGLTGEGVVLSTEDAEALDARHSRLLDDLRPDNEAARLLAHRVALLSVRMDRSARQEAAAISARVAGAEAALVDGRLAEAEHLIRTLHEEPVTNARRLKATPEGVDMMIAEWEKLKADLNHQGETRWSYAHQCQADYLNGRLSNLIDPSAYHGWTMAMNGHYEMIRPEHFAGIADDKGRRLYALDRLAGLIEADLAALREHRRTMDTGGVEAQRRHAAEVALFDPSKEAILARKYEAAAERGFFRALKELRELRREAGEGPAPRSRRSLASIFPDPPAEPLPPPRPPSGPAPAPVLPSDEVPITVGRAEKRRE